MLGSRYALHLAWFLYVCFSIKSVALEGTVDRKLRVEGRLHQRKGALTMKSLMSCRPAHVLTAPFMHIDQGSSTVCMPAGTRSPRELLRKQLREGEFGQCLRLTISYISHRLKMEKCLCYISVTP
jgi:hypothetical protein